MAMSLLTRFVSFHKFSYIKAGAFFDPLFGFNLAVSVQIGAEIAMPAHLAAGIFFLQSPYQHVEGVFLPHGHRVLGPSPAIQSALVADADTFQIMPFCMGADLLQRAGGLYIPVLADIKVIARSVEAAPPVTYVEVVLCEVAILARGGAVHHNEINLSHPTLLFHRFRPEETLKLQSPTLKSFSTFSSFGFF